jgi:ligand-binding sensor domain-containing protein
MKTTICVLVLCVVSSGMASVPVAPSYNGFGLDPSKEIYQYSHRIWLKKDGLPQNSIHNILQTHDGFLWFATDEGLARFDGLQFTVYNTRSTPQFINNQVRSLAEAEDGTLWIGFMEGGIVSLKDGVFTRFSKLPSFRTASIWSIFRDHANAMWFCSPLGPMRCEPDDSTNAIFNVASGLPYANVSSVAEDSSGRLMASTKTGISVLNNGRFETYLSLPYPIRNLYLDHRGTMWFIADNKAIGTLNADKTVSLFKPNSDAKAADIMALFEDRAGTMWIGTAGGGLYRFLNGKFSSFTTQDGLSSDVIESIFEDREGNLWVGTIGGGLNRFTNTKFTTFLPSIGSTMVWSIYEDRWGTIWGGSESGMLLRLDKGKFVPAFEKAPLFAYTPSSILVDRSGVLWVGSKNGVHRIVHWRNKNVLTPADYKSFDVGMVSAITEDSKGRIWIGTMRGLLEYQAGGLTKILQDSVRGKYDIRVIQEDRNKDLWLCTSLKGVMRMHDGNIIAYDSSKGMPSLHVMCMHEDAEGMLWFGTLNGGLVRWDGEKFSKLTYAQNMFDESIFSIQEDRLGNLWMSSNNGVFRVSKKDLNDVADEKIPSIHYDSYGMTDGMRSDECNGGYQNSGGTTRAGKMWFPTTVGFVMVDPQSLPMNHIPPPVAIELFTADKKNIAPASNANIGPGAGVLEFTYAGLSFTASEKVRFKVRLDGFDADWIDVGTRRFMSYTNIPPGRYRFHVMAANSDGVWNDEGTSLAFVLLPHFYQTYWFYAFCFAAIALSGAVTHKVYRRSKDRALITSRRQAQLEARLKESQLHSLAMQLQPHFLFNTLNSISSLMHFDVEKADRMIAHLGQLLRFSLERMKRQEVPLKQELEFLESYLCIEQSRLGDRLTIVRNIDDATLSALVPSMVWQPLVENAIKHGIAPRKTGGVLTLGATRVDSKLLITIQDNGEGMQPHSLRSSTGVGIRNTMDRLELLYPHHHDIRFSTTPGGGVTVTLRIPFRIDEYETDNLQEEHRTGTPRYTY